MKLVDQQRLHKRFDSGITAYRITIHRISNREIFQVVQTNFGQSIITFDCMLIRERSPMKLEIQFTCIYGRVSK